MAANGVLRRPDVFKAAVAGRPGHRLGGLRHALHRALHGPAARDRGRPTTRRRLIPLAKDLKRPLLLVHGTADDNVYYRHTLKLADALFRAGKDFEVLPLPGLTHMYIADPVVMERLWAKTAAFFKTAPGGAEVTHGPGPCVPFRCYNVASGIASAGQYGDNPAGLPTPHSRPSPRDRDVDP